MEKYYDLILYTTFIITSLIFPLWVSTYATKRGRPGWSKVAIFSILTGLGFFGGLTALTVASMKPGIIEDDELQITTDEAIEGLPKKIKVKKDKKGLCPKCDSNMIHRSIMVIDPVSGERVKSINQEQLGTTAGAVMLVFGIAIIGFTVFRFFTLGYQISYLAAAGVGCYFAYIGIRPWLARSQEDGKQLVEVFDCARCKHEWNGLEIKN